MSKGTIHQIIAGAAPGDAVTDQALLIRRWLHACGYRSDLYAGHSEGELDRETRPAVTYRPSRQAPLAIYHHSIGTPVVDQLCRQDPQLILIYHNVTPARFLTAIDPERARQAAVGRQQLAQLLPFTRLALADSPYNEAELREVGFNKTGVLPITLNESRYDMPSNERLTDYYAASGDPILLFVGRLAPNKRQEDLIKLLYHVRRIRPGSRLILVGSDYLPAYTAWLRDMADELGLGEAIDLPGRVSQRDLVTYYRIADLYVSMSEHEGFGKPLLESMYLDLPIVAFAASAVPGTLGGAGILFHRKEYEALAELVVMIHDDPAWRERIVAGQRERIEDFLEPQVRQKWESFLYSVTGDRCRNGSQAI